MSRRRVRAPAGLRCLLQIIFDPKLIIRRRLPRLYEGNRSVAQELALNWSECGSF